MKIQKIISVLLAICILPCTLCACRQQSDQKEAVSDSTQPELKIGVDSLPPFFYIDENGNSAGIDAEIATEACKRAGYTPVFTQVPWSDRDSYLEDGTVDCLWTAFIKDGREDDYLWTDSYLESKLVAIVDQQAPDKSLKNFNGAGGVAVRAGSKSEEILLDESGPYAANLNNVYSCGSFTLAETAFVKGYAAALAGHQAVLQQILDNYPDMYRYLDDTLMVTHLGVAFKKDAGTEYYDNINSAIREMKQDGFLTKIAEKYHLNSTDTAEVSSDE